MKSLLIVLLLAFSTSAYSAKPLQGRELDKYIQETEQKCKDKKEELLKEAREKKIEECIETKEFTPSKCKSFYRNYGNQGVNPGGYRFRPGMFDSIPECEEAFEARKMKGTER